MTLVEPSKEMTDEADKEYGHRIINLNGEDFLEELT